MSMFFYERISQYKFLFCTILIITFIVGFSTPVFQANVEFTQALVLEKPLILNLTGCSSINETYHENVFFPGTDDEIILGVLTSEYCRASGSRYCEREYFPFFNYAVDNEGQIYLLNLEQKSIDIFDQAGGLKGSINLAKSFERYRKFHKGSFIDGSIYLDLEHNFIYFDLSNFYAESGNSWILKYSTKYETLSEVRDREGFENSFLYSQRNVKEMNREKVFIIPREDGSTETLDATSIKETGAVIIGADVNYVYYLANAYSIGGALPKLIKATRTFEIVDSIEIPLPYKTYHLADKDDINLFWGDIFLSDSGDVYISFIDEEKDLWYIKKYAFNEDITSTL